MSASDSEGSLSSNSWSENPGAGHYTYNGFEQLIGRVITNSGTANGTVYTVHDVFGNVLAELDGTGSTVREYIWLPEAQIAPVMSARTTVDRPMAVVSGVNTTPALLMVHVDQLNRPIKMTSAAGAVVWSAVYSPFGGAYTLTGTETNNARFPGQWFQLEAGLHYNWHRHYEPSLGRYTQPDPLGFVDGPSVFAYSKNEPSAKVDISGLQSLSDDLPQIITPLMKPFICQDIRDKVLFYCKSFPYSIFSPTKKCVETDDCSTLENKWKQRRDCIKWQSLLTTICYPNDPTHQKRFSDESDAIFQCRFWYSKNKCGCLPQ